jgi:hypothetical protein
MTDPTAMTPTLPVTAAMPSSDLSGALILRQVTDRAWQVCDSRRPPHTPGHLLGFVEETATGVELMQLGEHFVWTGFATMAAALSHVAETAYVTETRRAAGDLAWLT